MKLLIGIAIFLQCAFATKDVLDRPFCRDGTRKVADALQQSSINFDLLLAMFGDSQILSLDISHLCHGPQTGPPFLVGVSCQCVIIHETPTIFCSEPLSDDTSRTPTRALILAIESICADQCSCDAKDAFRVHESVELTGGDTNEIQIWTSIPLDDSEDDTVTGQNPGREDSDTTTDRDSISNYGLQKGSKYKSPGDDFQDFIDRRLSRKCKWRCRGARAEGCEKIRSVAGCESAACAVQQTRSGIFSAYGLCRSQVLVAGLPNLRKRENMACACNSTYVSSGCCSVPDGLIWEDPSQQLGVLGEHL